MKTCPLGHTCDECLWHQTVTVTKPDGTPDHVTKCALLWMNEINSKVAFYNAQTSAKTNTLSDMALESRNFLKEALNGTKANKNLTDS